MKNNSYVFVFLLLFAGVVTANTSKNFPLDELYRKAQREFQRKNYTGSLPLLERYLSESKSKTYKKERLFWAIDQIGRIHLRVRRDPDGAIEFFEKILKDKRLDEAQEDDVVAWLNAAKDWKKLAKMPKTISDPNELFEVGKLFYNKANLKKSYPADNAGDAYYSIARTYLMPFIVNNENHPQIGEALFMMGDIQLNVKTDPEYWNDNFYLKEVIRRFPHTKLAFRAYTKLEEDVALGYTGSGGNNTPPSIKEMLKSYKRLAEKKKTKGLKK